MILTHLGLMQFFPGMGKVSAVSVRRHPGDPYAAIRRDDDEIMQLLAMSVPLLDDM